MCTSHPKKGDLEEFQGLTAEEEETHEMGCRGQLGSVLHHNKARHICFSDQLLLSLADPSFVRPRVRPPTKKKRRPKQRDTAPGPEKQVSRPSSPVTSAHHPDAQSEHTHQDDESRIGCGQGHRRPEPLPVRYRGL